MENRKIISSTAGIFTLSLGFVSAFNLILSGSAEELRSVSQLFTLCGEGISSRVARHRMRLKCTREQQGP